MCVCVNDRDCRNAIPIVMEWSLYFLAQGLVITSEVCFFFFFYLDSLLTLRLLMSYIYIYIYIYIYMEHLFLMFLDHTQRRSTVGRTPLDE